ncbi:helicase HerA-like domain-containing protein [Thalassotalea litorea]|uniref:helicase HerA-like domain-containing protein n=1 Tax=Thalassotalea litorea TaxID=2020715 RepID=UPI003735F11E
MHKLNGIGIIDEAHLIFSGQSTELASQLESMVKLIRSKGVGLFFVTQNATDISPGVLSQLGLKIQHAVRAFTAKDRKALKQSVENLPDSEFYDATDALTNLGVGEAIVTGLGKKSVPTPLVTALLRAPQSRMGVLTDSEVSTLLSQSPISDKYNEKINRESAYEILNEKLAKAAIAAEQHKGDKSTAKRKSSSSTSAIVKMLTSATFVRGVFGLLNKMLSK